MAIEGIAFMFWVEKESYRVCLANTFKKIFYFLEKKKKKKTFDNKKICFLFSIPKNKKHSVF